MLKIYLEVAKYFGKSIVVKPKHAELNICLKAVFTLFAAYSYEVHVHTTHYPM